MDFDALSERLERIVTPRLALRQVSPADAWPLFAATRNPLFNLHLLWDQPAAAQEVWDRVHAIVEASRRGRLSAVSAVVRETGAWVSLFRFQPVAAMSGVLELGVWTHPVYWHGRYSLELGRACVDAAFSLSDVSELVGAAAPENRSSCRLMELCGMQAGELKPRTCESGATIQLRDYRITRSRWDRRRPGSTFELVDRPALRRASDAPALAGNAPASGELPSVGVLPAPVTGGLELQVTAAPIVVTPELARIVERAPAKSGAGQSQARRRVQSRDT